MEKLSRLLTTKEYLVAALVLVSGCQLRDVNFHSLEYRNGVFYSSITGKPFSGDCVDNGKYEGRMTDGKRVGVWRDYMHPSMSVFIEYDSFVNGVLNGVKRIYSPSGDISATVEYINGVKHGDSTRYDTIGKPMVTIQLLNGEESGRYISFYPNGQKKEVGQLLNGYRKGTWTFYSEEGDTVSTVIYRNGFVDSVEQLPVVPTQ